MKRANKMKFDVLKLIAQLRPFRQGFLHAVFAKNPLSSLEQRLNAFCRVRFGNAHQLHITGFAAKIIDGLLYARAYFKQPLDSGKAGRTAVLRRRGVHGSLIILYHFHSRLALPQSAKKARLR